MLMLTESSGVHAIYVPEVKKYGKGFRTINI